MMLIEARFAKRKTQYDLHILTGIHQSKLSLIENGFIIPSEEEKVKIERVLDTKIDWNEVREQKKRR